ncbi:outer membrane protein transport protein [Endozoicomonas gorgoniicola]|uniref:Outer membrane protein transport protein n=1 Tax=Endozoicomonas gorgoniicola TaxID=1234144 RepID=A0ABT3N4V8_9GAMM|nr:outer membrane protein transport protein [Endozoicomonas gorgoniicola]MCW7556244.1 outer membrane protein transport protein [Endozoicomonas gorgoniicola]
MPTVLRRKAFLISSLALAVGAGNAVAGGFEKATMWDAKYTALGGAAASSVNNSSAIFYNPAGLAFSESNDIAVHASPTVVRANGPANGSDYTKGKRLFVPNGGFTGAYRLSDDFVLGYGVYAAGGAAAKYKGVTTGKGGLEQTGDYGTEIKLIEAGLALAYKINNNWSVGGTYRLTYAYADIDIMSKTEIDAGLVKLPVGVKVGYNDLSGIDSFGMRLGAMYRSDDNRFGWGINYRSKVDMKAKGDYSANVGPLSEKGKATAKTVLPMQISTGVDYLVSDNWRLFGEATYTNYKKVDKIEFDTDISGTPIGKKVLPQLNTNWKNQMNYRFAAEYYGLDDWTLRGGYVYTTAVVPEKYAAPTFSTPAAAHTYILGAGTSFLNDTLLFDFAAEYNRAKNKNVKGGGHLAGNSPAASGRYDTEAFAVHATLRYKF